MVIDLKRPKGRLACKVVLGGLNYLSGRGLVGDKTWLRNFMGLQKMLVATTRNLVEELQGLVVRHDDLQGLA